MLCLSQLSVAEVHWGALETTLKSIIRGVKFENNLHPMKKKKRHSEASHGEMA